MEIQTQNNEQRPRSIRIGIVVAILLLCVLSAVYLAILPGIDYEICTDNVTNRLGIEHTRASIMRHIEGKFHVGMSASDAHTILNDMGRIVKMSTNGYRDIARLRMCTHPANDFLVFIYYDRYHKVERVAVDNLGW